MICFIETLKSVVIYNKFVRHEPQSVVIYNTFLLPRRPNRWWTVPLWSFAKLQFFEKGFKKSFLQRSEFLMEDHGFDQSPLASVGAIPIRKPMTTSKSVWTRRRAQPSPAEPSPAAQPRNPAQNNPALIRRFGSVWSAGNRPDNRPRISHF